MKAELTHKSKRSRSPNFPAIDLEDALELAWKLYAAEKLAYAPLLVIVTTHWGFGARSSAWKLRTAALGAFGLLDTQGEGDERQAKISELARRILLDQVPNSPDRAAALRAAALKPLMHQELQTRWPSQLASDATVTTYLTMDRGFTEKGARSFLAQYRSTIAFAGLAGPDSSPAPESGGEDLLAEQAEPDQVGLAPTARKRPLQAGVRELPITLPSLNVATLSVPIPMTSGDYDYLKTALETLRAALVATQDVGAIPGRDGAG